MAKFTIVYRFAPAAEKGGDHIARSVEAADLDTAAEAVTKELASALLRFVSEQGNVFIIRTEHIQYVRIDAPASPEVSVAGGQSQASRVRPL